VVSSNHNEEAKANRSYIGATATRKTGPCSPGYGRVAGVPDSQGHRYVFEEGEVMTTINARQAIIQRMARYGFTPEMCADKTPDQLLHLAAMLVGHRRYLGILEADEIVRLGEMEKLAAELRQVN